MTTTLEKNSQRILVVDDESSISELISTSLRFVGFDVRTAANGAEALRVAEEFKPHAMVLDVMLPDLDGFEVCKNCLLYTSPSPRDRQKSRMPYSA